MISLISANYQKNNIYCGNLNKNENKKRYSTLEFSGNFEQNSKEDNKKNDLGKKLALAAGIGGLAFWFYRWVSKGDTRPVDNKLHLQLKDLDIRFDRSTHLFKKIMNHFPFVPKGVEEVEEITSNGFKRVDTFHPSNGSYTSKLFDKAGKLRREIYSNGNEILFYSVKSADGTSERVHKFDCYLGDLVEYRRFFDKNGQVTKVIEPERIIEIERIQNPNSNQYSVRSKSYLRLSKNENKLDCKRIDVYDNDSKHLKAFVESYSQDSKWEVFYDESGKRLKEKSFSCPADNGGMDNFKFKFEYDANKEKQLAKVFMSKNDGEFVEMTPNEYWEMFDDSAFLD